ncbi:MAG: tRNA uridine-5-carboxymethylaminomethyl(34) synthesis enzyme MnmG, partial [Bacteroidota bacterium]
TNRKTDEIIDFLSKTNLTPTEVTNFLPADVAAISEKQRANKLLLRPQIELDHLLAIPHIGEALNSYPLLARERASISIKYKTYIDKEIELADKMHRLEDIMIPANFDYMKLNSISMEAREKLTKIQPQTLGQASRISGVNPADIQVLLVYFGR